MAATDFDDLASEAPPAKRVRIDTGASDEILSTPDRKSDRGDTAIDSYIDQVAPKPNIETEPITSLPTEKSNQIEPTMSFSGIPGLGRLASALKPIERPVEVAVQPEADQRSAVISEKADSQIESLKSSNGPQKNDTEMTEASTQARLETVAVVTEPNSQEPVHLETREPTIEVESTEGETNAEQNDIVMVEARTENNASEVSTDATILPVEPKQSGIPTTQVDTRMSEAAEIVRTEPAEDSNPPPLTHALEALLGLSQPTTTDQPTPPIASAPAIQEGEEHPEWEVDSSPIESSSDSSSDDSSSDSDSDEDGENSYKLLSPEEQARILMEGDGGSDDEGGSKTAKGASSQLRTKNEVPEEIVPKPDVTITSEMKIEELGDVEAIVENIALIKAKTSGEYRVLKEGSVLCLEDRTVVGAVAETLGRVQQPLYCIRFTNPGEITEAGLSIGTKVFYSEQHSTYVFTQTLKQFKGSDASNLHDEEVGDEEIEFSDDEAEAEHKRRLKQKRTEKRGGKLGQNGGAGHPLQHAHTANHDNSGGVGGLKYDDDDEDDADEPYKPLARPAGFIPGAEAPLETLHNHRPRSSNDQFTSRGGGRGRGGRGDHRGGRGRGNDRGGRGRGNYHRGGHDGYSKPPSSSSRPPFPQSQPPQSQPHYPPISSPGAFYSPQQNPSFPAQLQPPPLNNFYNPSTASPSPQSATASPQWPQFPPQFAHLFPGAWQQPPSLPPAQTQMNGAFLNPAFFGAGGQQQGQGQGPNGWNQNGNFGQGQGQNGGN